MKKHNTLWRFIALATCPFMISKATRKAVFRRLLTGMVLRVPLSALLRTVYEVLHGGELDGLVDRASLSTFKNLAALCQILEHLASPHLISISLSHTLTRTVLLTSRSSLCRPIDCMHIQPMVLLLTSVVRSRTKWRCESTVNEPHRRRKSLLTSSSLS